MEKNIIIHYVYPTIYGDIIMPTYDYKCLNCGNNFEFFQPMTADPIEKCPKCNGKVKRLIGAGAGPIFKGNGFYHTDYKNKSSTASANKVNKPDDAKTNSVQKKTSEDKK